MLTACQAKMEDERFPIALARSERVMKCRVGSEFEHSFYSRSLVSSGAVI
jgi:hypothetical protein